MYVVVVYIVGNIDAIMREYSNLLVKKITQRGHFMKISTRIEFFIRKFGT